MQQNWAIIHRPYANRIQMQCAECGEPLGVLERGKTCESCARWPLCDGCAELHVAGTNDIYPCNGQGIHARG